MHLINIMKLNRSTKNYEKKQKHYERTFWWTGPKLSLRRRVRNPPKKLKESSKQENSEISLFALKQR